MSTCKLGAAQGVLAAVAVCLLGGMPAGAQTQAVTVNTGGLTAGALYEAEFTLTDGSASGMGLSQALISNFSLTGGNVLGSVLPPTTGDAAGDLNAGDTLALKDDAGATGLADFAQAFTAGGAGSALTFDLDLTATGVNTPTPDNFTFQLLDNALTPVPTGGPTGAELVSADYTATTSTPQGYSGTAPAVSATVRPLAAPAVPEPAPVALFTLGLLPLGLLAARRRNGAGGADR